MDIKEIKKDLHNYFIGENDNSFLLNHEAKDKHEKFLINTIKRLINNYELYRNDSKYYNDYLISIRNYLITFNDELYMPDLSINELNPFGLNKDKDGWIKASYSTPSFLSQNADKFIKEAFNTFNNDTSINNSKHNLYTDSFVYNLTGYTSYKSMAQKLAVTGAFNVPNGNTVLISLPTGGGKSLITQTIAYAAEGLTIVIIPTVSLAIDQVRTAKESIKRNNVNDEIFQYTSGENAFSIIKNIKDKKARLLFISPETLLQNENFKEAIEEANKHHYLKNIIIDEAHIVAEWGESFRIEYQCLESWRNKLILSNSAIRTFLLSATFERTEVKILKKLFCNDDKKWTEIRCDSLREEPRFIYAKTNSYKNKMDNLIQLVHLLPHPLIIYVINPKEAESITKLLQNNGINNTRQFTGATGNEERKRIIQEWTNDEFDVMVATSAFGVGVDKGDVRTVIHMYVPQTPNSYYQELGRGGRDGLPCLSVLNIIDNDVKTIRDRVNRLVLTSKNLLNRWFTMLNSERTRRDQMNIFYIDASVTPTHGDFEVLSDDEANATDINWNFYVLLFLRRNDLIKIVDVLPNGNSYIFMIKILESKLFIDNEDLLNIIDSFRDNEFNDKHKNLNMIIESIYNKEDECWSEMFFDTYELVQERCSGCANHTYVINEDKTFPLKRIVSHNYEPIIPSKLLDYFENKNELMILYEENKLYVLIEKLINKSRTVLVDFSNQFINTNCSASLITLNYNDFISLLNKGDRYFISGVMLVVLSDDNYAFEEFTSIKNKIYTNKLDVKVIYLTKNDIFVENRNKYMSDFVDGSFKFSYEI